LPKDIVQGADGAMWFTEGADSKIGRISGTGVITEYGVSGSPIGIIAGPDGALWFTETGSAQYGRIATDGSVSEHAIPTGAPPSVAGLAFGTDGNLYVADNGNAAVYAVTPATGALVQTYALTTNANAVVSGPDGNVWVGTAGSVARIRLSDGIVSTFATAGAVTSLAAGSDGNVWFTDRAGKVGNVSPAGAVTEFAIPTFGDDAYKIVAAPDGTYWFTYGHLPPADETLCRIGHATASGSITSFAIADCRTTSLAFGPDHNLWLTEFTRSRIGIFSSF
jgi:streptogramin lyase